MQRYVNLQIVFGNAVQNQVLPKRRRGNWFALSEIHFSRAQQNFYRALYWPSSPESENDFFGSFVYSYMIIRPDVKCSLWLSFLGVPGHISCFYLPKFAYHLRNHAVIINTESKYLYPMHNVLEHYRSWASRFDVLEASLGYQHHAILACLERTCDPGCHKR